ncbi:MAG: DUF3791 domain-containing protein [Peptostreptococcaceae bacterium]|nr:DUF3791 domain-containing protein [Peptostreptococcaceae bacterium]
MNSRKKIENARELEFAVFCIENLADEIGVGAEQVYEVLTRKSDILNDYIVPEYEILHTQSKEYIIQDILEVMKKRGIRA